MIKKKVQIYKQYYKKYRTRQKLAKDTIILLDNLSLLLNEGYSLKDALHILQYRFNTASIIYDLQHGETFTKSIKKHFIIPSDIILMINLAEKSNQMTTGIQKAYKALLEKNKQKAQTLETVKYPFLMLILVMIVITFVNQVLLPQFQIIYHQFGIELGYGYQILFFILKLIPKLIIISFIFISLIYKWYQELSEQEKIIILTKFTKGQNFYLRYYNFVFAVELNLMLKSGLKIDEALKVLKEQEDHDLIKIEAKRILNCLSEGISFSESLKHEMYSQEFQIMVQTGEEIGFLKHTLANYTNYAFAGIKKQNQQLLFLIQPITYGIIGTLIILLYASILLPMYEMMENLY